jgi:lipoprotein Spr
MATVLSASSGEPRRKSGLFCTLRLTLVSALVFLSVLLLSGCGGTSPRFRTGEKKVSASGSEKKANSSKSVSESADEEDREKKADDAEKVLAGTRSFKTEKNSALSNLDQAKMMREISKMMGVRYKLGGDDQNGIDCSAYTMLVYKNSIGKPLPRTSTEQSKDGLSVSYEDLKFGDLVFFNTTGESASHVGIYLGDELFAHASVTLGVTISSLESYYYKKRYEGARRIIE